MELSIKEIITDKISGEWGNDATYGEGVKVIRTANFTNLGIIDYSKIVYRNIEAKKIQLKRLRKGDIIIEKSGGSPTQPVGRVVFFDKDSDEIFLCNNFTAILRPDTRKVYPKYLFYQLFLAHIRGKTLRYQNKTTGIINLKLDSYLEEKIGIPLLEDQIRIATVLNKVETLIQQRKECMVLLDEFLKNTFLKMFSKIQNPNYRIGILEHYALKITDGTHLSPKFISKGVPFLLVSNIVNNEINYTTKKYISEDDYIELNKRTPIEIGDILITSVGSYGNPALVKTVTKFAFQRHIAYIKPNKAKINNVYLLEALKSDFVKKQIEKVVRGVAQKTLNLSELRKLKIPILPIEEQNQFSEIVSRTESIKTYYQSSLQELENLFFSLGQKAFKGELDLSKMKVLYDEEYSSTDNDRTEPKPIDFLKINIKYERFGDPFALDEETAKKKGKEVYNEWKRLNSMKIPEIKGSIDIETKVAGERLAKQIRKKYEGKYFSFEMLMKFLQKEKAFNLGNYFSSEEIKANPKYDELEDLKMFFETAIVNVEMDVRQKEKINPWLKLNQHFYDAKKENIKLELSKEDVTLIKNRTAEERSGIYFSIVPDEAN